MSSWSPREETNRSICRSWKMKRNARLPPILEQLISQFSNAQTAVDVRLAETFSQLIELKHSTFSARGSFRNPRSTSGSIVKALARIIHEGFYCTRGYAVPAGGLATRSLNILFQVCFSLGFACQRHCRLIDSPASTNVALIILRAVDLTRVSAVSSRTLVNNAGLAKHLPQLLGLDGNQFARPLESLVTSVRGLLQSGDLFRLRSVFALRVVGRFYFDPLAAR